MVTGVMQHLENTGSSVVHLVSRDGSLPLVELKNVEMASPMSLLLSSFLTPVSCNYLKINLVERYLWAELTGQ